MTEDSLRVQQTKDKITRVLFALLSDDTIDRITVSEICGKAAINRSTFYNHFDDIYDVRNQCVNKVLAIVEQQAPQIMKAFLIDKSGFSIGQALAPMGPYFDYFSALIEGADPSFLPRLRKLIKQGLLKTLAIPEFSAQQEYVFVGIFNMQLGIVGHWLRTGRALAANDLAALTSTLFEGGAKDAMLLAGLSA